MFLSWLFGSKPANGSDDKTPALAAEAPPKPPRNEILPPAQPESRHPPVFSERSLRQLGLFFGGAGFMVYSILLSRRAITRHQLGAQLKFYQPNHLRGLTQKDPPRSEGAVVAAEALVLATLNTMSFGIMAAGGLSWAFDISSVDDLRRMAQRSIEEASGNLDENEEREVAEWITKTLGIKEKPSSDDDKKS
ncbi:hypothetical protein VTK56DRAFT_2647 [Thermocarpiscus australiensis]